METIYAPVNIEEIQVQEQPDNHECDCIPCSKEAVYKITIKRNCTCDNGDPILLCIPHKEFLKTLSCQICSKVIDIISITYTRR